MIGGVIIAMYEKKREEIEELRKNYRFVMNVYSEVPQSKELFSSYTITDEGAIFFDNKEDEFYVITGISGTENYHGIIAIKRLTLLSRESGKPYLFTIEYERVTQAGLGNISSLVNSSTEMYLEELEIDQGNTFREGV